MVPVVLVVRAEAAILMASRVHAGGVVALGARVAHRLLLAHHSAGDGAQVALAALRFLRERIGLVRFEHGARAPLHRVVAIRRLVTVHLRIDTCNFRRENVMISLLGTVFFSITGRHATALHARSTGVNEKMLVSGNFTHFLSDHKWRERHKKREVDAGLVMHANFYGLGERGTRESVRLCAIYMRNAGQLSCARRCFELSSDLLARA